MSCGMYVQKVVFVMEMGRILLPFQTCNVQYMVAMSQIRWHCGFSLSKVPFWLKYKSSDPSVTMNHSLLILLSSSLQLVVSTQINEWSFLGITVTFTFIFRFRQGTWAVFKSGCSIYLLNQKDTVYWGAPQDQMVDQEALQQLHKTTDLFLSWEDCHSLYALLPYPYHPWAGFGFEDPTLLHY